MADIENKIMLKKTLSYMRCQALRRCISRGSQCNETCQGANS
jgi:hypothetical protein